jgi:hypothetical protein
MLRPQISGLEFRDHLVWKKERLHSSPKSALSSAGTGTVQPLCQGRQTSGGGLWAAGYERRKPQARVGRALGPR